MRYFIGLVFCMLFSCDVNSPQEADELVSDSEEQINIILVIGDGMGVSHLSTIVFLEEENPLEKFEQVGLVKTSSASHLITDSAASATAIATGKKTYNSAIGVDTDTLPIPNITSVLKENGYSNGLIATSTISHATPAAFYAHVDNRGKEQEISNQLLDAPIDFFAGGGLDYFTSKDSLNNTLFNKMTKNNFQLDSLAFSDINSLDTEKAYGLLANKKALPKASDNRGDFLLKASEFGLEYLSKKNTPFFLMIESSQIDWAGHENNDIFLDAEMKDFNSLLTYLVNYTLSNDNTLLLVTADHETGGHSLTAGKDENNKSNYNSVVHSFSTKGHTANMVPLLAIGEKSEIFGGVYENTEIYHKLVNMALKNE